MKVLVIPEDPKLDQYILKPIVERIFEDLGKSPRVTVLSKPRLRGVLARRAFLTRPHPCQRNRTRAAR